MSHSAAGHLAEDRLVDLALGLLDADDAARASAQLRDCVACEQRFQVICGEIERRAAHGVPNAARSSKHSPWRVAAPWAAAAALAGIAILAGVLLHQRAVPPLVDYWYPLESERILARSAPAPGDDPVIPTAVDAYLRHDTGTVVELLWQRSLPPRHDSLKIMLASALVHERRFADALEVLERLDVSTLPLPARDRARWIEAQACLGAPDTARARRVLQELASQPGEFSAGAHELLTRL